MQFSVTGKQLDVGDALRTHVEESLQASVDKYFDNAIEANVVFSRVARHYRADISVHVGRGILVQSHAEVREPYPAFDAALERLGKRLRRHKRRLRNHHKSAKEKFLPAQQYILAGETEEPLAEESEKQWPVIIAEMATEIPTLTVGEAVMRLDLGELPALMFSNSAHRGLNVVYRRSDGNIGWIDPQGEPPTPKKS